MSTSTREFNSEMQHAVDMASSITPSVLAIAIVSKVSPKALAQAIADGQVTSEYRTEIVVALLPLLVAQAKEDAEEAKEG